MAAKKFLAASRLEFFSAGPISPCIMCVQYTGGYSVRRGDIMSTSGGSDHDACGGIPLVHWRMFSTLGDIMSTSGDIMSTLGGYHEYIGGCSVHWGFQ